VELERIEATIAAAQEGQGGALTLTGTLREAAGSVEDERVAS
jgi:hypothetical protein